MFEFAKQKTTFLNWFLLMVVLAVGCAFGFKTGAVQPILALDKAYILRLTSFVAMITFLHIGFLSWRLTESNVEDIEWRTGWMTMAGGVLFTLGIVGSGLAFYQQSEALAGGAANLAILGQGVLSTVFASAAACLTFVMSWNLSHGIARIQYLKDLPPHHFFGDAS